MTDLVLGIDLGSTSVKAAVLDRAGNCLSRFAEAYPTARPSADRAEQDPADWMRLIEAAMARFAADGFRGRIGVGGLCSQVNTHVF
ncbi:MAG: xylulokinase, partial [Rhizobiaceae bacterium]|nr:xylulokinase [Rhizobiaceae bacterium]